MTVKHPKMQQWDDRLLKVFERVDEYLEDTYGDRYRIHQNRPPRGTTAHGHMDGLFNVGASFSPGYGTELGRGYVIEVVISTLEHVPAEVREDILEDAVRQSRIELEREFPHRNLSVSRDGLVFKIHGDLGLGDLA